MARFQRDIRPALTAHKFNDNVIVASFNKGGLFQVTYRTHFGETRILPMLRHVDACIQCSKLRTRGYNARVKPMKG